MDQIRFLINTMTDWNEPPRARHQLTRELSKSYPVVFVSASRIGIPGFKRHQESGNLEVLIPYFPLSTKIRYRIARINSLYQSWLYNIIKRLYPDAVVVNFDFTACRLHRYFSRTVYYCNDDFIGMSRKSNPGWIARYHEKCEKTVAKKANFCVATSEYLTKKLSEYNVKTFEIHLGAPDVGEYHFEKSSSKGERVINVGIVGYINTIDFSIIDALHTSKDLTLIIVGPGEEKDLDKYRKLNNIILTGSLTGSRLYEEISGFDVGLIPYRFNSEIDRTPNKLWLYLAMGIPVVMTNITGIKNWQFPDKMVYRADHPDDFYQLIHQAHRENNELLNEQRREYARQNTWGVRVETFMSLINQYTTLKNSSGS